ncbi:MAG TPA: hypothetical protein GXZ86_03860 [Clostridiales bacterium]|jgi:hypothetical protein|nr:hypothetical protein [Clostridiales bacterium]
MPTKTPKSTGKPKDPKALRRALIALSLGLIVYGIYSGEVNIVLRKAIYMCLECIGIG